MSSYNIPNTGEKRTNSGFSILIPTWNNLPYLKLCIDSIRKNSSLNHQIIVHVNDGVDGTLDWVKTQNDLEYTASEENVGVCYALNIAASLARTDYILYINDDMYVCPQWDTSLMEEILNIGHKLFFLSATSIELRPQSNCSIKGDFGLAFDDFKESELLKNYDKFPMSDWCGATWPPNVVHKELWTLVGGYSTEFSPGMYSDPDFSMKLWRAGVRLFKGVNRSRVYHFGSQSVKRVKKNKGYYQFLNKWGMTSSTMSEYILKRGEPYFGYLGTAKIPFQIRIKNIFKRTLSIITQ